jgi:hypothetical protein
MKADELNIKLTAENCYKDSLDQSWSGNNLKIASTLVTGGISCA